jgi:hypothetical protein
MEDDLRAERVYPPTCPFVHDLVSVAKLYVDFHDIWSVEKFKRGRGRENFFPRQ